MEPGLGKAWDNRKHGTAIWDSLRWLKERGCEVGLTPSATLRFFGLRTRVTGDMGRDSRAGAAVDGKASECDSSVRRKRDGASG